MAPTSVQVRKFNVFLTFRGSDTLNTFASNLYAALERTGIRTFRDTSLPHGIPYPPELIEALEDSDFGIPIISKNYAHSGWCLRELDKMVEHFENDPKRAIFPVFYHVEPSDIKLLRGEFGEGFKSRSCEVDEERMKEVFINVSKFNGFTCTSNKPEACLIDEIVKVVLSTLISSLKLHVADHPVGIESQIKKIKELLDSEGSDAVRMLGIYGMGGSGKTVLAKAIFNELFLEFESTCFREKIRETFDRDNGLNDRLLHEVISELTKGGQKNNISSTGASIMKSFSSKKVLVVLDNVHQACQVAALARGDWFGRGSVVIITTRDADVLKSVKEDVLKAVKLVCKIYKPPPLDRNDARKLFSFYASAVDSPYETSEHIIMDIIEAAQGLPQALEVYGRSHLASKGKGEYWKPFLGDIYHQPTVDMIKSLKISYDDLPRLAQKMFLDIACFFVGVEWDYLMYLWWDPESECAARKALNRLISLSLVTLDVRNKLAMHVLIRDMGRHIVENESGSNVKKQTRLWMQGKVLQKLLVDQNQNMKRHSGQALTELEGIMVDSKESERDEVETSAFTAMENLRILRARGVRFKGQFSCMPKDIQLLEWYRCPQEALPSDMNLQNVAVLNLSFGNVKKLVPKQTWMNLRSLDLRRSAVEEISGFHLMEKLAWIMLDGCDKLVKIEGSILQLKGLVFLSMNGCCQFQGFESTITCSSPLEHLDLSGCSNLLSLPEDLGALRKLRKLLLGQCIRLGTLPNSVGNLTTLEELVMEKTAICSLPDSIGEMKMLKVLHLDGCWNLDGLPSTVGSLSSLERLSMRCCAGVSELPPELGNARSLSYLDVSETGICSLPPLEGLRNLQVLEVSAT